MLKLSYKNSCVKFDEFLREMVYLFFSEKRGAQKRNALIKIVTIYVGVAKILFHPYTVIYYPNFVFVSAIWLRLFNCIVQIFKLS